MLQEAAYSLGGPTHCAPKIAGWGEVGVWWSGAAGSNTVSDGQPAAVPLKGPDPSVKSAFIAPMDALYGTFYVFGDGGSVWSPLFHPVNVPPVDYSMSTWAQSDPQFYRSFPLLVNGVPL